MTRKQFLYDLIEFYSNNPRAIDSDGTCKYRLNGLKCAIGRYIPDSLYNPNIEGPVNELPEGILPKEIEELGINFLEDCQSLHDQRQFWQKGEYTLNQLSYEGMQKVDTIRIDYKA